MKIDRKLLGVRITLTLAVIALVLIFAATFIKMPDNDRASFTYIVNTDGSLTITGYTGDPKKLEIPEKIDGKNVKIIGERALGRLESRLEKVIIPEGVEEIGVSAFADCQNLSSVSLPKSLKKIGYQAFSRCAYLVDISLPSSLEVIEACAFENCTRLPSLKIPTSVIAIGEDAFIACESLILDASLNPIALEYADRYSIPTSLEESGDYIMTLAIVLFAVSVALFIAAVIVIGKIKEKKLEANAEKENTDSNTSQE